MTTLLTKIAAVLSGLAIVAVCAAGAPTHSNLGPSWTAMILGVAAIGAIVRTRRARILHAA